ncbi:unnamed protein product [Lactuca saligna]|uniref:Uncharacterized protein n=1 Tax=Lactuca saligna TaxID=75948 RepID=A0AA35YWN8_LACSI|nr:unnamed protein product [Lactuca saligna]
MLYEAVELSSVHWLEPVALFDMENTKDSQFDMLITRRAFVFHCFDKIADVPSPDAKVDRALIDFYLTFAKPQYSTWSAQKIITVKVIGPFLFDGFVNIKFKATRGSNNSLHKFSLADLPNINPHDWIVLLNLLLTEERKYEPIVAHLKRMLGSYIYEVAKPWVMKRNPTVNPIGKANDMSEMILGKIDMAHLTVMFQQRTDVAGTFQKCLFALPDKHLFSMSCLEHVLEIIPK